VACNCGGQKKAIGMTSAQVEEAQRRQEFERRVAEETAKASTGEHDPGRKPLPKVVYRNS
jgi:hypothetical protein